MYMRKDFRLQFSQPEFPEFQVHDRTYPLYYSLVIERADRRLRRCPATAGPHALKCCWLSEQGTREHTAHRKKIQLKSNNFVCIHAYFDLISTIVSVTN
jgi:hypothetical protein